MRLGPARSGVARQGIVARLGVAGQSEAGLGWVWQRKVRHSSKARFGMARHGQAGRGVAKHGKA